MNKVFLLLMTIALICFPVYAETFKVNENSTLRVPCDSYSDCTTLDCNIKVTLPNGSPFIQDNMTMTYYDAQYNISPTETGKYLVNIKCYDSIANLSNMSVFYLNIVDENFNYGGKFIMDYKVLVILLALAFLLIILYSYKQSMVIGVSAGTIFLITGLFTWFYGINLPITELNGFQMIPPLLTRTIGTIFGFFGLWLVYIAYGKKEQEKQTQLDYEQEDE